MEKFIIIMVGFLVGIAVSTVMWGKKEGETGLLPNLRIPIGKKTLYVHHWLVFSFLILLLTYLHFKKGILEEEIYFIILGTLLGGVAQGIKYKDWYVIFK